MQAAAALMRGREKGGSPYDPMVHGSVIFTYVHADEFCEQEEMNKTVTTLDEKVRGGDGQRERERSHHISKKDQGSL